ncbi:minor capsid protein [Streptomyces albofaciens]|uniref:minor capsid protein n=1 Tax=Streptomyces albofaciens TaxID=66866 RepID=UPI001FCBBA12|nr:minor capsid protein [Streptomyces albofaciens]
MSYTVDLLDGLARLLDTAGVGTYRPDGVYAAGETAITIAATPPVPDRVICLSAYPVEESAALTDTTTGIQVRTRAGPDPREVDALDDQVLDVLHGSGPTTGARHGCSSSTATRPPRSAPTAPGARSAAATTTPAPTARPDIWNRRRQ